MADFKALLKSERGSLLNHSLSGDLPVECCPQFAAAGRRLAAGLPHGALAGHRVGAVLGLLLWVARHGRDIHRLVYGRWVI